MMIAAPPLPGRPSAITGISEPGTTALLPVSAATTPS